ncbi:MAG: conjugal transfer protein, partial [Gramella sp.]|nr:conjugal transfer protein [Christiangramia sp.]
LEKTKQSDLLLYQVDQRIQRYRDIISFRQMQEQLNTRSSGW